MRNNSDIIASILLIIIGIAVVIWSIRLEVGTLMRPLPGFFPLLTGFGFIVLSLILLVQGWLGSGIAAQHYGKWKRPSILFAALVVYTVILEPLGYILSTLFMAAVMLRIMRVMSWKVIGVVSPVVSVTVYVLFTRFLGVELPAGVLPF